MKVLFLDSWTVGINNFVPIAEELKKLNIEHLLVHRGSIGAEPGRPKEEKIKGICCRDIAYYDTKLLYKIIEREQPNVIVILTTFYILDRAVILAARALRIKTVFLMPGIREVDEEYINGTEYETKFKRLNKTKYEKIPKYLRFVLPNYFYSGLKYSRSYFLNREPWKAVWELFTQPGRKVLYPTPTDEIHCDKALVYANKYRDFFSKKYGYPLSKIEITGNPSLDPALKLANDPTAHARRNMFLQEHQLPTAIPIVTYLATPFVEADYKGWTPQRRIDFVTELAKCSEAAGMHLVVKLHPAIKDPAIFQLGQDSESISVFSEIELAKLVFHSSAVIGHHSSTLLIPIVLDKPLFIPRWGLTEYLNDRFSDKGVALPVHSLEQMEDYFLRVKSGKLKVQDEEKKREYLREFVTFLDGGSINRIVSAITQPETRFID